MPNDVNDKRRVIVSLTSYPARIDKVWQAIETLRNQTIRPWKIILWLAETEFPGKLLDLPENLLRLRDGVFEIDWCENIYSYKKLIPALIKYPNDIIITADDDILYEVDMVERLLNGLYSHPSSIQAVRIHTITSSRRGEVAPYSEWVMESMSQGESYEHFQTGAAGVLYTRDMLDEDVIDASKALSICPKQDDVWFWGMAVKKGTRINSVSNGGSIKCIEGTQEFCLWNENSQDGQNDKAISKLLSTYPEIKKRLKLEHPALKQPKSLFCGFIKYGRDGKLRSSIRINLPLFSMTYNADCSRLTYRVFRIPVWTRKIKD